MQPLKSLRKIASDQSGSILTLESIAVAAVIVVGLIAGMAAVRDSVISEMSDLAGAVQDANQSFSFRSAGGHSNTAAGSDFLDTTDHCDDPDDIAGSADNCVLFDLPPTDESIPEIIVLNNGFDEDVDPDQAIRTFGRSPNPRVFLFDSDDVDGWETTAPDGQIEIWESGFGGVVSQDGDYHAEINGNSSAQLFQDIEVTPGSTVEYSIWHRGRSGVDVANVLIGPPGMQAVDQTMTTGNAAWVNYTGTYTVPAGVTTLRIGFESVSTASGNASSGNFIDNLEVTVSP